MKLDEKLHGYRQIASQSSFLYRIIQKILHLKPFYEPSLQFFEEQFKITLADCERINSDSGSTVSRVAEVTFQFSLDLYKRICLHIFKGIFILTGVLRSFEEYIESRKYLRIMQFEALVQLSGILKILPNVFKYDLLQIDNAAGILYYKTCSQHGVVFPLFCVAALYRC